MNIIHLISGPIADNTYILYDESNECAIVDAPFECAKQIEPIIKEKGLVVKYILITHTHWDHIGGLAELKNATNATICVHKEDAFRLKQEIASLGGMDVQIQTVEPDKIIKDGEILSCGNMQIEVLHTPGHSPGAVCYLERKFGNVFVGDTLFHLSIGRTDFPGSDYATLINSIKTKLLVLPDDFKVFCGHNESTTIGFERNNNPYLDIDKSMPGKVPLR